MLTTLTLERYRCFRKLRIEGLTRVNLFVGTNNAGKTSVLEAAEALASGTVAGLLRSPRRRGEQAFARQEELGSLQTRAELDPAHLFHGHVLQPGASFSILGDGDISRRIECQVVEVKGMEEDEDNPDQPSIPALDLGPAEPDLAIRFESHLGSPRLLRISPFGVVADPRRSSFYPSPEIGLPVQFLGTETLEAFQLGQLWDAVVLTPEEGGVAAALRIIEPRIERIAFLGENRRTSRSIFLKLSDSEQRLPLGSVGDGLKRLLALTLNLFSARGGFLLVDEIDTGLHYSVMAGMWKLIIETARRLDVQVFATTHSLDCVHALAWVREANPEIAAEVTLHRIEKGVERTVAFNMDELAVAARNHLEVR